MVAQADLERFRLANAGLSAQAQTAVESFFGSLDMSKPDKARDALLEFMPRLTAQYGDMAATVSADWYDELRAASGAAGRFRALAADSVPADAVAAKVRYLAGNLWTPSPADMLGPLLTATDKYVKQPGRDTIAKNAGREGVRWARVPSGAKTCAFCLMLASRAAVYLTEAKAKRDKSGELYHGFCDCQPVRIAKPSDYPTGYLPDDYYAMYKAARGEAGSGDIKDIAAAFRRIHPEAVTDGIGRAAAGAAARDVVKVAAKPALLTGQALADTVTYHSTLHMSDGDLAEMMSKYADDPVVFDKIMEVMDERDAKYMTVDTRATGAKVASLSDKPPAPVKLDPSPVTNPAVRKTRNMTQIERASEEYTSYTMAQYSLALDDLNGVLLNAEGKARARALGQDLEIDIFSGSAVTARKYASEELLRWWEEQGRETLGSFRYKMYGWNTDRKAAMTVRNLGYERGQAFRDRSTF